MDLSMCGAHRCGPMCLRPSEQVGWSCSGVAPMVLSPRLSFHLCSFIVLAASAVLSAQSIAELQKLANSGDPQAQFRLGMQYAAGQSVPLDIAQAVAWYRKAAEKGVGEAEYNLG